MQHLCFKHRSLRDHHALHIFFRWFLPLLHSGEYIFWPARRNGGQAFSTNQLRGTFLVQNSLERITWWHLGFLGGSWIPSLPWFRHVEAKGNTWKLARSKEEWPWQENLMYQGNYSVLLRGRNLIFDLLGMASLFSKTSWCLGTSLQMKFLHGHLNKPRAVGWKGIHKQNQNRSTRNTIPSHRGKASDEGTKIGLFKQTLRIHTWKIGRIAMKLPWNWQTIGSGLMNVHSDIADQPETALLEVAVQPHRCSPKNFGADKKHWWVSLRVI